MLIPRLFSCLACLVIAGCADSAPDGAAPLPVPSDAVVIRGEAMYFERIATPPDARLDVSLVNRSLADSPDAMVSTTTVVLTGAPPFAFELAVDPAALDPRTHYSVRVSLRDGEDRVWFTGEGNHSAAPGDPAPLTIRMKRVAADDPGPAAESAAGEGAVAPAYPIAARYRCGDRLVDATFTADAVTLGYDGIERQLPIARSASGARYAQDGDEFWSKGDGAMLTLAGERSQCATSDETTPWEEAKARGMTFRATGNEPGWLAEVGSGRTPTMRLLLDHGERELVFDVVRRLKGGAGFQGESDGVVAELRLIEADCVDTMSGESFPVRVELRAGDVDYRGCGRRLAE